VVDIKIQAINTNQHITLPLEALFERLGNAGFDCSPAARTRAYRLLAVIGPQAPEPEYLRGMLAPLFARSADEQKRFYEIFDRYWLEISKIEEEVVNASINLYRKKIILTGLILFSLVAAGLFSYKSWNYFYPEVQNFGPDLSFEINAPRNGIYNEGDTVQCKNTSNFNGLDSSKYTFHWRLQRSDGRIEQEGPTNTLTWNFPTPGPDIDDDPQIVLILHNNKDESQKDIAAYQSLNISCPNRPILPRWSGPKQVEVDQLALYSLTDVPHHRLLYIWSVDSTTSYGTVFVHRFKEEGTFNIHFSVADTTQPGYCVTSLSSPILVTKPVEKWPKLMLFLATLMTITLIIAIFLFISNRKKTLATIGNPVILDYKLSKAWVSAPDRPPYYIPFREPKGVFNISNEQLRLGNALRLRHEGEDVILDIPTTILASVERGGYPNFHFRYRTRPSEYLFLIDEQMPGKHLARLFYQLAENLREREALLEILWYDQDFLRFWGPGLPKGVNADQLSRLYPQHRLVLLGDAHNLLDPFSDGPPRLRPGLEADLQGWKERLLLTPQVPDAWNWRERVLHRYFGLFPADLRGMLDAAEFVENGLNTEDLPARFEDWRERQIAARSERVDTNYRHWRTLRDHEDYLRAALPTAFHDIRRWLCALAILSNPTWEITLAMAHSLGIVVTHDRLLILARIPWLQDGKLNPRLRRELLAALSADDETLARSALRDELEAVRTLTGNSHAAHELEGTLAVQHFLLNPNNVYYQNLITIFLENGTLTRLQEDELDFALGRWLQNEVLVPTESTMDSNIKIRGWLASKVGKPIGEGPIIMPSPDSVETIRSNPLFKYGIPAIMILVLSVLGIVFGRKMMNDNKFQEYYEQSTALLQEGKLKQALDAVLLAKEIHPDDSAAIKLRREIFRAADMRHAEQLSLVKGFIDSYDPTNYTKAQQLLENNREDASILIAGDSTDYYLILVNESKEISLRVSSRISLGDSYFQNDEYLLALREYQKALDLAPNSAVIRRKIQACKIKIK
jgi:hypothetical protein